MLLDLTWFKYTSTVHNLRNNFELNTEIKESDLSLVRLFMLYEYSLT